MRSKYLRTSRLLCGVALCAMAVNAVAPVAAAAAQNGSNDGNTTTPIKHVIVIIGENRTFDHVFATYRPKRRGAVSNLLSKGIVNSDGTPGPNFSLASQSSANDSSTDGYQLNPSGNAAYSVLPPSLPVDIARHPSRMWRLPSFMRMVCRITITST